jgi:hypothetical protein
MKKSYIYYIYLYTRYTGRVTVVLLNNGYTKLLQGKGGGGTYLATHASVIALTAAARR